MKALLAQLRTTLAAWLFLRRWHRTTHGNWRVPPQSEVQWSPGDAAALAAFLKTPSGAVLIEHLRWVDLRTTAHAVYGHNQSREFRCGYAAGCRAAISYMVTLSTLPAADAGTEQAEDGAAALLERLAP